MEEVLLFGFLSGQNERKTASMPERGMESDLAAMGVGDCTCKT
jgi:hypothetical protein